MQAWFLVDLIALVLSVPVLALSYYWVILFASSLAYPRDLGIRDVRLPYHPNVTILIATFNEKFVIERSLEAMKHLDYPRDKIQVVVADDSNDETIGVIDRKVLDLNLSGISAIVSRRANREHFKCGALNKAMQFVRGEYVLLLDSDSVIPPDILNKGIDAMESHPRTGFVSFRYGHYNRGYNMVTRLFAMSQDLGDTLSKMGSYHLDTPFSCQGGFTLVRTKDLEDIGGWTNQRIADDTDISIKMYMAGKRGIYLSGVKIMSEDPSTLEAWKKQVGRTSQGWWRCIAHYWKRIISNSSVPLRKRLGLILMLLTPFSSLSWILVTFLSATAIVFDVVGPSNSIFNNPVYIAVVTIPFAISLLSGVWALYVQGELTPKNLIAIPMLGYASGCMITLGSIGFFYGVFDKMGFFLYRTPKSGTAKEMTKTHYFRTLRNDRNGIVEGVLACAGLCLAVLVFVHSVWFLALSLAGYGLFTLKSMNLSKHFRAPTVESHPIEVAQEISS